MTVDDLNVAAARHATNKPEEQEAQIEVASQWKLMWWKFKRHKMAMIGGADCFVILYFGVIL